LHKEQSLSITTKKGDSGFTTSINKKKVKKNNKLIKFYGLLDETACRVGIARSYITDPLLNEKLHSIQKTFLYFFHTEETSFQIKIQDIEDYINTNEKKFTKFTFSGSNQINAFLHIARTGIRILETTYIDYFGTSDKTRLIYLNRLSDYFYILAENHS
jgi:ATP:cob(I)alamin adenosyltransferase